MRNAPPVHRARVIALLETGAYTRDEIIKKCKLGSVKVFTDTMRNIPTLTIGHNPARYELDDGKRADLTN